MFLYFLKMKHPKFYFTLLSGPKNGVANLADVDIHTVTGVLKLYLRELPEPLFTEACYQNFIDALSE